MNELVSLRKSIGFSQVAFSELLGVSIASLRRWENGDNRPSTLALDRINTVKQEIKAGRLNELMEEAAKHRQISSLSNDTYTFNFNGESHHATLMPYVYNGPEDQLEFFRQLVSMQEVSSSSIEWDKYRSRLSIVQCVDENPTAQYLLEQPGKNSRSWSADAGSHGWHRYVGRFPAQLIRSIVNYFGLDETDLLLDPFCGSGTTTVEARLLGIPAIGIEISPLSAMISRVKSCFPQDTSELSDHIVKLGLFYHNKYDDFLNGHNIESYSYIDIINRKGNLISAFSNYEKWFTKEALLGTSIVVEYISTLGDDCFAKEAIATALSAKMRSIGNVDVDVVRAEYRKTPRENVDVLKLVSSQLRKMIKTINQMVVSHAKTLLANDAIQIVEGDCLAADIKDGSVSAIITSPPYGVESLSYLRTHLLSFRALEPILGVDPYNFGKDVIGSEYLSDVEVSPSNLKAMEISATCRDFFNKLLLDPNLLSMRNRILMMMKFFEDMYKLICRFKHWLNDNGKVAFVIGNKRLDQYMIPTDKIIIELFEYCGFYHTGSIAHKLKTNNSNSKVPWQDRIIDNEFVLFFKKEG